MKTKLTNRFICDQCSQPCPTTYSANVDGKFMARCEKCTFKKKK